MDGVHEDSILARILTLWDTIEQHWPWHISWRNFCYLLFFRHVLKVQARHPRTRWLNHCITASLVIWWALGDLINHLERQGKHVTLYRGVVAGAGVFVVTKMAQLVVTESGPPETVSSTQIQHGQNHHSVRPGALEADLEHAFRIYLKHLVETSPRNVCLEYLPVWGAPGVLYSAASDGQVPDLKMEVLNPAFYPRFCCYAHDSEGIFSEVTEGTVRVDRPDRLLDILLKKGAPPLHARGVVDYVVFEIIRRLRRRPLGLNDSVPSDSRISIQDVRSFRISSMDAFILAQDDEDLRRTYRYALLQLFVANGVFGGSAAIVQGCALALRFVWCWAIARAITNYNTYLKSNI